MKTEVRSTCCYCGVGCGVVIETANGAITGVRGDPDHPANRGRLCTKGATLAQTAGLTYRLQHPERRRARGGAGAFEAGASGLPCIDLTTDTPNFSSEHAPRPTVLA